MGRRREEEEDKGEEKKGNKLHFEIIYLLSFNLKNKSYIEILSIAMRM
jgi:hypothetical protein